MDVKSMLFGAITSKIHSKAAGEGSSSRTDRWPTLAYGCLCTLELCRAPMIPIPVDLDICGIFCSVFIQTVIERVHCSAAYNFIW